jgi:hypothetical protein
MATTRGENGTPLPRSLATIAAIRREMVRVYRDAKAGRHDVQLIGRLCHILNSLVALDRDHGFEARLAALESALAERGAAPRKPNGQHVNARL